MFVDLIITTSKARMARSERGYCRIISVGQNRRMSEANEVDEELLVLSAISYIINSNSFQIQKFGIIPTSGITEQND